MHALPRHRLPRLAAALGALALVAPWGAVPAAGQVRDNSLAIRVSVNPHPDLDRSRFVLASIEENPENVVVRTLDAATGREVGDALVIGPHELATGETINVVDVLVSTVFDPGSVVVLDADRRVHVLPVGFDADGTPLLRDEPISTEPLGNTNDGRATVLGEVPNPDDAGRPFLAVGTSQGDVLVVDEGINRVVVDVVDIPVDDEPLNDLGAVAGILDEYFVGAVVDGRLVGVDPDADPRTPGLQPAIGFSHRDPRGTPLIDFGPPALTGTSRPSDGTIGEHGEQDIVTANGTTDVTTLRVPSGIASGSLAVARVDTVATPVKQVVLGSLTMLPVDGTAVLYNRGYTVEDGFLGRIWTIAGASMTIAPERLNLRSEGRFVTVAIEGASGRAAEIDAAMLALSVDGVDGSIAPVTRPAPTLVDVDGDGNVDLEAKFDRAALSALLAQTSANPAVVRARWLDATGAPGEASAAVALAG